VEGEIDMEELIESSAKRSTIRTWMALCERRLRESGRLCKSLQSLVIFNTSMRHGKLSKQPYNTHFSLETMPIVSLLFIHRRVGSIHPP
jgi:hypothetical protein